MDQVCSWSMSNVEIHKPMGANNDIIRGMMACRVPNILNDKVPQITVVTKELYANSYAYIV